MAIYDFAYSIFSFLFAVRFFPPWLIADLNHPDWYIGATQAVTVVSVLVLMPIAGIAADRAGPRKPYLVAFTLCTCLACAAVGVLPSNNVLAILVLAGAAIGFGQLAIAQFDPLLANVSTDETAGRVSGLAVALGFAGVVAGLGLVSGLTVGDGDK